MRKSIQKMKWIFLPELGQDWKDCHSIGKMRYVKQCVVFTRFFKKYIFFSSHKVNTHDTDDKRIWVTFKNGVYDITDFVSKHPGAKNILMAAGGSIEPFWNLYAVHQKVNYHIF